MIHPHIDDSNLKLMRGMFVHSNLRLSAQHRDENDFLEREDCVKNQMFFVFKHFCSVFCSSPPVLLRFAAATSLLLLMCFTFSLSCESNVNEKGRFASSPDENNFSWRDLCKKNFATRFGENEISIERKQKWITRKILKKKKVSSGGE